MAVYLSIGKALLELRLLGTCRTLYTLDGFEAILLAYCSYIDTLTVTTTKAIPQLLFFTEFIIPAYYTDLQSYQAQSSQWSSTQVAPQDQPRSQP